MFQVLWLFCARPQGSANTLWDQRPKQQPPPPSSSSRNSSLLGYCVLCIWLSPWPWSVARFTTWPSQRYHHLLRLFITVLFFSFSQSLVHLWLRIFFPFFKKKKLKLDDEFLLSKSLTLIGPLQLPQHDDKIRISISLNRKTCGAFKLFEIVEFKKKNEEEMTQ